MENKKILNSMGLDDNDIDKINEEENKRDNQLKEDYTYSNELANSRPKEELNSYKKDNNLNYDSDLNLYEHMKRNSPEWQKISSVLKRNDKIYNEPAEDSRFMNFENNVILDEYDRLYPNELNIKNYPNNKKDWDSIMDAINQKRFLLNKRIPDDQQSEYLKKYQRLNDDGNSIFYNEDGSEWKDNYGIEPKDKSKQKYTEDDIDDFNDFE